MELKERMEKYPIGHMKGKIGSQDFRKWLRSKVKIKNGKKQSTVGENGVRIEGKDCKC